jgi:hypothetical protein
MAHATCADALCFLARAGGLHWADNNASTLCHTKALLTRMVMAARGGGGSLQRRLAGGKPSQPATTVQASARIHQEFGALLMPIATPRVGRRCRDTS